VSSDSANATNTEIEADFVPCSVSEIIEAETPERAASARNVKPLATRRARKRWPMVCPMIFPDFRVCSLAADAFFMRINFGP
jgi:hypothetical protein